MKRSRLAAAQARMCQIRSVRSGSYGIHPIGDGLRDRWENVGKNVGKHVHSLQKPVIFMGNGMERIGKGHQGCEFRRYFAIKEKWIMRGIPPRIFVEWGEKPY